MEQEADELTAFLLAAKVAVVVAFAPSPLLTAAPTLVPACQSAQGQGESVAAKMTPVLVERFKNVSCPLVFDLPDDPSALGLLKGLPIMPNDALALQRVSMCLDRELDLKSGAYVVCRPTPAMAAIVTSKDPWEAAYQVLGELMAGPNGLGKIANGGIDSRDLGPDGSLYASSSFGSQANALNTAVAGAPITVSVDVQPVVTQQGKDGVWRPVDSGLPPPLPGVGRPLDKNAARKVSPVPFIDEADGDLNFGAGVVLRLDEFALRLKNKFAIECYIDSRADGSLVFVKGRFTKESARAVIDLLGQAPVISAGQADLRSALHQKEKKVLAALLQAMKGIDPSKIAYMQKVLASGGLPATAADLAPFGMGAKVDPPPGSRVQLSLTITFTGQTADGQPQNYSVVLNGP